LQLEFVTIERLSVQPDTEDDLEAMRMARARSRGAYVITHQSSTTVDGPNQGFLNLVDSKWLSICDRLHSQRTWSTQTPTISAP
jgi:hypothetical protein